MRDSRRDGSWIYKNIDRSDKVNKAGKTGMFKRKFRTD